MGIDIKKYIEIRKRFLQDEELKYLDELRGYEGELLIAVKRFKTYKELRKNYLEIIDVVAGCIQNEIVEDEFNANIKWNMYLIYVVESTEENIDYNLIEKIEKNDYCCKKYVLNAKDNEELDKQLETRLPILLDIFKKNKTSLENIIDEPTEDESALKFPERIKNYLEGNDLKLEEFLEEEITLEKVKEIYGRSR